VRIEAELYRAHDIENFDTAAFRCFTSGGAEVLFFVSHVAGIDTGPIFLYEFEGGEVKGAGRDSDINAGPAGGKKSYASPDSEPLGKIWEAIASVKSRNLPACGLGASSGQVLAVNGAQDSQPEVQNFPRNIISFRGEQGRREITVEGLADILRECFERSLLPSELGVSWSKKGRMVDLSEYRHYPGGRKTDGP
jgi:hypothetical protein